MLYSTDAVLALHRSRLEEAEARRIRKRLQRHPRQARESARPVVLRSAEAH